MERLLLGVGELQHRVDQVAQHVVDVEGEHPQAHAELRGGEAGTVALTHGVGQVGDERAQLGVEVDHRIRRRAQHRIPEQTDGLDGHAG